MQKDEKALGIILPEIEEMKEEGKYSYRDGKPNLAELSRRTGFSRKVLGRLSRKGFKAGPGTDARKTGAGGKVMTAEQAGRAKELLAQGVTDSSVLYRELREVGYRGGITTVKMFAGQHKDLVPARRRLELPPVGRVRRYTTPPGRMYQMDWGFVDVVDEAGGAWRCACFVMVCHQCGERYAEFFPNARQESLFIGMVHAFSRLGMAQVVLTDNMASVSNRRDAAGAPVYNADYDMFQKALGFRTRLCKARHPWTKGSAERLVGFVKGNFLQGKRFLNVTDLNMQALAWCEKENARMQKGLGVVPAEAHAREDLAPLPCKEVLLPYLAPSRKITADGFVYYEGRRYGVPLSYRPRTARVLREGGGLYILDSETYEVVQSHAVDWSYRPKYCEGQFEPAQPEELPTMPVASRIAIGGTHRDDGNDFSGYDF